MNPAELKQLAEQYLSGTVNSQQFVASVLPVSLGQLDNATLDLDRQRRCGFPEVVFGEGKSDADLQQIVARLLDAQQPVLVTRLDQAKGERLQAEFPQGRFEPTARTFRIRTVLHPKPVGRACVVTAGSSDLPVAEEACETLRWMGVQVDTLRDIGVAGPHRLLQNLDTLRAADVVVVVAGMEGALPSVVGGHVACPVIAVPTSVGYGAAFGGLAALLGMLNSCAANVTVVNIDGGFKGGYIAGLIACQTEVQTES